VNTLHPSAHSITPYDDATVAFNQGSSKALWMNLVSFLDGGIISQHNYAVPQKRIFKKTKYDDN
jgi:hypothetical protein